MEFNLSDYNIGEVAKILGKKDDYKKYYNRSMSFMNLYDENLGVFRPKNKDGTWYKPFNPEAYQYKKMKNLRGGPGFVEGSSWQYMYSIPHGIDVLRAKMGDELFLKNLNTIFD